MDLSKLDKYDEKAQFVADLKKRTFDTEMKCHGCAQVIVQTFLDVFEEDNTPVSMASSPFAAGLALTGNNCGAVIGGLMVLGLVFGRKDVNEGMAGILAGIRPMRKLVKYFQETYQSPIAGISPGQTWQTRKRQLHTLNRAALKSAPI